jgi:Cytochrome c oxidase subunit IV
VTMAQPPVPGTEGPAGHELGVPVDDRNVPWRVFAAIAVIVGAMAVIYWATAYEEGGTVLLVLTAVLACWIGTYLWLQLRGERDDEGHAAPLTAGEAAGGEAVAAAGRAGPGSGAGERGVGHYLPHASAWPFAIGLGAAAVANGLVLGLWLLVPGVGLLALGIVGFVRQSRRRD